NQRAGQHDIPGFFHTKSSCRGNLACMWLPSHIHAASAKTIENRISTRFVPQKSKRKPEKKRLIHENSFCSILKKTVEWRRYRTASLLNPIGIRTRRNLCLN